MKRFLDWVESLELDNKIIALLLMAVGTLLVAGLIAQCAGPRVTPIPEPLQRELDQYDASAPKVAEQIAAAWRKAEAARARSDSAEARAKRLEQRAAVQGRRADSLAVLAAAAPSAPDSARLWHAAYVTRTSERDTLQRANDSLHVALAEQRHRADSLDRSLTRSDSLYHRADSLLKAVTVVAKSQGCTVPGTFGRIGCPSRRTVALVAVVGTVTTLVLLKHHPDPRELPLGLSRDERPRVVLPLLSIPTP